MRTVLLHKRRISYCQTSKISAGGHGGLLTTAVIINFILSVGFSCPRINFWTGMEVQVTEPEFKQPKAAIVSTVKGTGSTLESWLEYHTAVGFEKIFLFFDDPQDKAIEYCSAFSAV